jgi:large subunit ribosomal protein L18
VITRVDARAARVKRARRVRARIPIAAERPRLTVYRSSEHIYAQVVDDEQHRTLVAASTLEPELRPLLAGLKKAQRAEKVGTTVAQRALERGIKRVAFDRGGFRYQGRIQALADAARRAGLDF